MIPDPGQNMRPAAMSAVFFFDNGQGRGGRIKTDQQTMREGMQGPAQCASAGVCGTEIVTFAACACPLQRKAKRAMRELSQTASGLKSLPQA
ncbi:hypothetical protein NB693_20245, partial [Pantoea ananatis]|uniref:hypothetical protein n=1 Tax=Pantoea ananas TaxID=553 RepID=UPI00221F33AD|nr:hypothetical protein [Pantoea ananatis]